MNFSFLCDPIAEVADPEADFARLSAAAVLVGVVSLLVAVRRRA